ncbi:MAG: DUF484 family protein [Gammaproteobacteria bacterium]|nr:DUF484 family protein [Gammaproteobacteria bacterium]MDH5593115.1 DUF484 family protein [Gammaproteobacteria bacterium]MDH5614670.1 DUF484 family protein [Gammaproteobacteria bacterium]
MTAQQGLDNNELDQEKTIADYLRTHPDFFSRHTQLLSTLKIPHHAGDAISLVEYQVSALREQKKRLERELKTLISVARDNDQLSKYMHRLTVALMETATLNEIVQVVQESLRNDFNADAVALRLFIDNLDDASSLPENIVTERNHPSVSEFEKILNDTKPVCGKFRQSQMEYLFSEQHEEIKSAALIPVSGTTYTGILAIASHDKDRYHAGMGTLFLQYIGDLLSCTLRPFIEEKEHE